MRTPEVVVHIAKTKRDHAQSLSAGECSGHLFGARSAAATEYRQISRRLRVLTHSGPFAGMHLHSRPYGDTRKLAVPPDDGITTGIGTWRVVDLSDPRDGTPRLKFVCCYGSRLRSSKITHCALSPSGDASPSSTTLRCGFFPGCGICAASGAISSP